MIRLLRVFFLYLTSMMEAYGGRGSAGNLSVILSPSPWLMWVTSAGHNLRSIFFGSGSQPENMGTIISTEPREEMEPKFRLARPFIHVLQPASCCFTQCCAFRLELAIRWRHSAAEFLHLLPRAEDKNGMRKFGSLSSLTEPSIWVL